MSSSAGHDLSHIRFEGKAPPCPRASAVRPAAAPPAATPAAEQQASQFIAWTLERAGLDAAAYRAEPLQRRLPACLRALKVSSTHAARALLEKQPRAIPTALSALLIGVTEFFREPAVFAWLAQHAVPALALRRRPLRIWSAACSDGAELYSFAILLADAGLLEHSHLLGTDCRGDAIERARAGLCETRSLRLVDAALRQRHFEPVGRQWRPVEALRRRAHWKVADLLSAVEQGPWDVIFWRNAAIYLNPRHAEAIGRRLASVLAADGILITGRAERPPAAAGLTHAARCVYRASSQARDSILDKLDNMGATAGSPSSVEPPGATAGLSSSVEPPRTHHCRTQRVPGQQWHPALHYRDSDGRPEFGKEIALEQRA